MAIFAYFAVVILMLSTCSNGDNGNNELEAHSDVLLLNFTSDFDTGELRWMDIESTNLFNSALPFGQDSKISTADGHIFILSRYPGVLTCILPERIGDESAIKQKRLNAENPYEAVVIGNEGYIALRDEDYIQVFDPSTCALTGKIDLPVKSANAASIKASGDTLLVLLQRLIWEGASMSTTTPPGLLVRINASTGTFIDSIRLNLYNPSAGILSGEKLYISQTGLYDANMNIIINGAGIEVVDLTTGTAKVLVTGPKLGGGASSIALDKENDILYVVAYESFGQAPVKPVNLANITVGAALPDIINSFGGIIFDKETKKLFAADRPLKNPGLKIYSPATNQTIAVNQGSHALPPYSLAIYRF